MPPHKLLIVGASAFAEVAFEYFSHDSEYEPVAFVVEREFMSAPELLGLPIVPMDEVVAKFPPATHSFYAALVYTQMNRLRTRLMTAARSMGYEPASYVSSQASVWPNVEIGDHSFVFEDNTLQPFARVGQNVVLWSGNHIGHHSAIGDNSFISSHVVISGFVEVGKNCFFGVNSTIGNNVSIGDDTFVGAGAIVTSDVAPDTIVRSPKSSAAAGALERFG